MPQIRPVQPDELFLLKDFAPPDWNTDLPVTFAIHFGQPYFHLVTVDVDGVLAGCANLIWNRDAGWLGNIIVRPEFRGRGIGTQLTRHLVDQLHSRGCKHQVLIATSMGEPIYRRLGFETVSQYVFLKADESPSLPRPIGIRPGTPEDHDSIFEIDRIVTGEDRHHFLAQFLEEAWVHEKIAGNVDGFYLPGLGQGPVLATDDNAGLVLLGFKVGLGSSRVVVPEANSAALETLRELGFKETSRAPRMVLGSDTDWHPEHVYCRGAGYCG